ncbi:hypothetical protein Tco_0982312 [Tanacetum coccineum]
MKKFEDCCSENLYVVSIKEDTAYLCLHFTGNHERLKSNMSYPKDSIRRLTALLSSDYLLAYVIVTKVDLSYHQNPCKYLRLKTPLSIRIRFSIVINTLLTNEATTDQVEMDDPNITMQEYIELECEKDRRRSQTFNWETAIYGKVGYYEDIDYFKDFETDFPAIVYKDALAPDHEILSEPAVSPHRDDRIDFEFKISFDESDDEDYIVSYDKKLFSYKITFVNDLKPDSDNDQVEINISSEEISIEPSDSIVDTNVDAQSHEFKESSEMNHDIRRKSFIMEDYFTMIKVVIQTRFHEGMPLIFIIKIVYVPFGIPFVLKRYGACMKCCEGQGGECVGERGGWLGSDDEERGPSRGFSVLVPACDVRSCSVSGIGSWVVYGMVLEWVWRGEGLRLACVLGVMCLVYGVWGGGSAVSGRIEGCERKG